MKKGCKFLAAFAMVLLSFATAIAADYRSVLKKWTRHDSVFVLDNLEARMIWNATYLSPEYRQARLSRLAELYERSQEERRLREGEDGEEQKKFDVFFVGLYTGSSQWSDVGRNEGLWKAVLETGGGELVESLRFERIPITPVERNLYPYLDKWSQAYLLTFPKTLREGRPFRLRMTGIPARSELVWKHP